MSSSPAAAPREQILRLHCVKIFVRDQEKSLRFYVDQLGFELVSDTRLQSGERWIAVAPPDGTALLSLVAPELESKDFLQIGRPTGIVFIAEDVVAKYREWSKRGVRFLYAPRLRRIHYEGLAQPGSRSSGSVPATRIAPVWGGVFTHFRDIDGNSFSLVSFDEVTQEIEKQRREAEDKLEAERRTRQELEIAKQVQAGLFPQRLPTTRTVDFAGVCVQARQVGGDYYDFLALGQDRLALVIGDVAGKGIAAALLMANLQANFRSQCATAFDEPERLLRAVNQLFCENTPDGSYATLFFAQYDDRARRLRYANCGHLCGLLLRADGSLERLGSTATVLGLFKDWDCECAETKLNAGDVLALYTDGVTEARDHSGDEFGEARLVASVERHRNRATGDLLHAVLDDLQHFSPAERQDDITLIVAKGTESGGSQTMSLPFG
jgi:serine phosphatase RsbU (regulator of sigma subunit)/catechol 2,3-dioxygenase-like lactoylglutathione lyase family enzyme